METRFIRRLEVKARFQGAKGFYLKDFEKAKVTKHKLIFKKVKMKRKSWHYSSRDESGESEERDMFWVKK